MFYLLVVFLEQYLALKLKCYLGKGQGVLAPRLPLYALRPVLYRNLVFSCFYRGRSTRAYPVPPPPDSRSPRCLGCDREGVHQSAGGREVHPTVGAAAAGAGGGVAEGAAGAAAAGAPQPGICDGPQ